MSILKVARMGHPVLRERARPLDKSDIRNAAIQKLIDDMIDTMHEYHGVGLAAPQVHEGWRMFVAMLDEDPGAKSEAAVIINPEIIANGAGMEEGWEGCLSIPDIRGMVPRLTDIRLKALDRTGRRESSRPDLPAPLDAPRPSVKAATSCGSSSNFRCALFLARCGWCWPKRASGMSWCVRIPGKSATSSST